MNSRRDPRHVLAAIVIGVLVGGGIMAVTPAGAEVASAASTNWKKIWKKNLAPLADKRYYKKAASDARYMAAGSAYSKAEVDAKLGGFTSKAEVDAKLGGYYSKAEVDAKLGGYYTKVEADSNYQPKGNYAGAGSSYTKAESDAKYAPVQPLYRGTIMLGGVASGTLDGSAQGFSFGATFASAPTAHYIKLGTIVPLGCSGTAAAPNAAPGHLCLFESQIVNLGFNRSFCSGGVPSCFGVDAFGAGVFVRAGAAGQFEMLATWAARPTAVVNPSFAPAAPGAVNGAATVGPPVSAR